jgi:hypothetical protein
VNFALSTAFVVELGGYASLEAAVWVSGGKGGGGVKVVVVICRTEISITN